MPYVPAHVIDNINPPAYLCFCGRAIFTKYPDFINLQST